MLGCLACLDPRTASTPEFSLLAWSSLSGPPVFQNQWSQLSAAAAWGARSGHAGLYFNGRYYLIGGRNGSDALQSEVWSSADGASWVLDAAPPHPAWNPSDNLAAAVHAGALWVAAGFQLCVLDNSNCVFQTTDGQTWNQTLTQGHAQFQGRREHRLLVHNGALFLLAGRTGIAPAGRRVHASLDGSTWTLLLDPAPYFAARRPCVVSFRNRLWLIGGRREETPGDTVNFAEVWQSLDGVNWSLANAAPGFAARNQHECFVFGEEIVLIGGTPDNAAGLNDIWTSADGVNWRQRTAPPWPARRAFAIAHNGANVLLFGGADNAARYGDVWLGW